MLARLASITTIYAGFLLRQDICKGIGRALGGDSMGIAEPGYVFLCPATKLNCLDHMG